MNPELTNESPLEVPIVQEAAGLEPQKPAMAPVAGNERIDVIDILRGLALFGILTANMRGFAAPLEIYGNINRLFTHNIDWIAQAFVNSVFQGKFITLFAFLFGLGFAVQMTRAEERGKPVSFYPRRLAILLCIGLIHALLIWPGDILFDYACTGFALLLFRKRKQKTVATWAVSLWCVPLLIYTGFYIASWFGIKPPGMGGGDQQKVAKMLEHAISVYRDGSYFARVQQNWKEWLNFHSPQTPLFYAVFILPRFLAGLWVFRSGLLKNPLEYMPTIRKVMWSGLGVGLLMDAIVLYCRFIVDPPNNKMTFAGYTMMMAREISLPAIAAFYAASVFILMQNVSWKRIVAPFAAVGRMALSNYLVESLFFTLFFHYSKIYGKMGPALGFIPTILFFAIQVVASNWWLQRYQFGPAEWAWRSLTYGKMQPMRREYAIAAAA